ncbi:WecB/TagA/CpsF family glycosyltransferase [Granulicella arctica]|uniref:N-acetylglucosaminyldiphosphoundecaprenol N-acetyl-beta-D-mannosaminyltransferase n=1 Tax=Granulicella arctica TaxID=940613 RepID=A0A7Y9PGV9_9BACT|nr:N-acetylglucosaminyldiphosphoundecaprenol N-acetyl-beta-D-mannosaminyltransferase [Granulicella arctica]
MFETTSPLRKANGSYETDAPRTSQFNSSPFDSGWQEANREVSFLGLTMQPKSMSELNALVEQGIAEGRKWIITNHNLHSLYLLHRWPKLRKFYADAHWTFIDGMPLVALGRLYGYSLQREHRVTLADWLQPLMELAASKGWRVFNLGSPKGVGEKAAAELRKQYPALQIEVNDGYFDARHGSPESEAVIERINAYRPDLLMVGMGMPRQEYWTHENFARLDACIIMSSNGAAMDYIAGTVPTPPRWAGRLGLEWAFRLLNEPRRLFGRYLVEPWYILMLLSIDYLRTGGRLKAREPRKI